jgi:AraC-like DNA-binding protein
MKERAVMAGEQRDESLESTLGDSADSRELVSFHRRSELPGVEIRSLHNCARRFHCYSTEFQFFVPVTWSGEVWHQRRQLVMVPGAVLCAHPGELYFCRRVIEPGAANFLGIEASVLDEYLPEQLLSEKQRLRPFTNMSQLLEQRLQRVVREVRSGTNALEIQSAMAEFASVMTTDLLEDPGEGAASIDSFGRRVGERVRECLHFDPSASLDLSTLAKQAGVSRFQALRMFKLRYGLPPHTYQLSVRLALAQKALREGQQIVQVATQYGFFDQSHLTRHFKRLLGVTPAQYARAGTRSRPCRAA